VIECPHELRSDRRVWRTSAMIREQSSNPNAIHQTRTGVAVRTPRVTSQRGRIRDASPHRPIAHRTAEGHRTCNRRARSHWGPLISAKILPRTATRIGFLQDVVRDPQCPAHLRLTGDCRATFVAANRRNRRLGQTTDLVYILYSHNSHPFGKGP